MHPTYGNVRLSTVAVWLYKTEEGSPPFSSETLVADREAEGSQRTPTQGSAVVTIGLRKGVRPFNVPTTQRCVLALADEAITIETFTAISPAAVHQTKADDTEHET